MIKEYQHLLGKKGTIPMNNHIRMGVEIIDIRMGPYQQPHALVRPVAGSGEMWVLLDRVRLEE